MTRMFITAGTTFVAPTGWPGIADIVECIGGGGGGGTATGAGAASGGGGGAYAKSLNVTIANGAAVQVGAGGAANTNGTDTWVVSTSTIRAAGGSRGVPVGAGGAGGAGGVGGSVFVGGAGGPANNYPGGGGGGAGGPGGVGKAGGGANSGGNQQSGGGGGGAGGGSSTVGQNVNNIPPGAAGGTAQDGTAGGAGTTNVNFAGNPGSHGSGGSGACNAVAGKGGDGVEYDATHGAGGGGGGACSAGGAGGKYGGGGGGGGYPSAVGGAGGAGLIIITYTPVNPDVHEDINLQEVITRQVIVHRDVAELISLSETPVPGVKVSFAGFVFEHLTTTETLSHTKTLHRNVSEPITLLEYASVPGVYDLDVAETLTLDEIVANVFDGNVNESLVLAETINNHKSIFGHVAETLDIAEVSNRQVVVIRNVHEIVPLKGGMDKILRVGGGIIYNLSEAEVVKVSRKCTVILDSPFTSTSIVLPCPEFGDDEKNLNTEVIKRSMTNVLYTYIRRNDLQELSYTFVIGRKMAYYLQSFVQNNLTSVINMTNWKGEIWKVQISNNPVEFTAKGRWENEGEKWEVTLEFRGVRIL